MFTPMYEGNMQKLNTHGGNAAGQVVPSAPTGHNGATGATGVKGVAAGADGEFEETPAVEAAQTSFVGIILTMTLSSSLDQGAPQRVALLSRAWR